MTNESAEAVQAMQRALKRTTTLNLVLLTVLVLLLLLTGAFIYRQAKILLDPDVLVARGEERLKQDYPRIRHEIRNEVSRVAPKVAAKTSKRLLELIPEGRTELEALLERETDSSLAEGLSLGKQEFRRFLQANRERIRQGFGEIRRTPERSNQLAGELEKALDAYLGTDIKQDIQMTLDVLRTLCAKLRLLESGGKLTRAELVELRIVRILRAMQERGPD